MINADISTDDNYNIVLCAAKYPNIIKEVRGKGLLVGLCLQKEQKTTYHVAFSPCSNKRKYLFITVKI